MVTAGRVAELQKVFRGLGDEKWREVIDGRHARFGPFVYDECLHGLNGGKEEPGYLGPSVSACARARASVPAICSTGDVVGEDSEQGKGGAGRGVAGNRSRASLVNLVTGGWCAERTPVFTALSDRSKIRM